MYDIGVEQSSIWDEMDRIKIVSCGKQSQPVSSDSIIMKNVASHGMSLSFRQMDFK